MIVFSLSFSFCVAFSSDSTRTAYDETSTVISFTNPPLNRPITVFIVSSFDLPKLLWEIFILLSSSDDTKLFPLRQSGEGNEISLELSYMSRPVFTFTSLYLALLLLSLLLCVFLPSSLFHHRLSRSKCNNFVSLSKHTQNTTKLPKKKNTFDDSLVDWRWFRVLCFHSSGSLATKAAIKKKNRILTHTEHYYVKSTDWKQLLVKNPNFGYVSHAFRSRAREQFSFNNWKKSADTIN